MFLLFAGERFYPKGGAYDFNDCFDSVEEAMSAHYPREFAAPGNGWAHIFCLSSFAIVSRYSEDGDKWEPVKLEDLKR